MWGMALKGLPRARLGLVMRTVMRMKGSWSACWEAMKDFSSAGTSRRKKDFTNTMAKELRPSTAERISYGISQG